MPKELKRPSEYRVGLFWPILGVASANITNIVSNVALSTLPFELHTLAAPVTFAAVFSIGLLSKIWLDNKHSFKNFKEAVINELVGDANTDFDVVKTTLFKSLGWGAGAGLGELGITMLNVADQIGLSRITATCAFALPELAAGLVPRLFGKKDSKR